MGRPKGADLTGQRFGRLVVMSPAPPYKGKYAQWRCICDCGNEKITITASLKNGRTKSCGCLSREHMSELGKKNIKYGDNLVGKRFGRLVVELQVSEFGGGHTRWQCRCDCGKESTVTGSNLIRGKILSCGCYKDENASKRCKEQAETIFGAMDGTKLVHIMPKRESRCNNTGVVGVHRTKTGTYVANINFKGKPYFLGTYRNFEDAVAVRKKAEEEMFGPFIEWYKQSYPERYEKITKNKAED